jgi:hypothetical protein
MDFSGELVHVGAVENISDKFRKRMLVVLDTSGKYPNEVAFELVQDNTGLANGLQVGDQVAIGYDVRGRRFTRKDGSTGWMNSLQAWRVTKHGTAVKSSVMDKFNDAPF